MSNEYSPAEIQGMEHWAALQAAMDARKRTPERRYVEDLLGIIERDIRRKLHENGYDPSGLYPLEPTKKKKPRHVSQLWHALRLLGQVREQLDSGKPETAVVAMFHATHIAAEAGLNFKRTAYLKNATSNRSLQRTQRNKRIFELYSELREANPHWGKGAFYDEIHKRLVIEGYEQSSARTIRRVLHKQY